MNPSFWKHGTIMEVDIHGLTADHARRQLEQFLSRVSPSITEVVVIHGYNGGQVLMNMVRNQLKHPRIASKMISLNSGRNPDSPKTKALIKKQEPLTNARSPRFFVLCYLSG